MRLATLIMYVATLIMWRMISVSSRERGDRNPVATLIKRQRSACHRLSVVTATPLPR
jgi:hypothetical protein